MLFIYHSMNICGKSHKLCINEKSIINQVFAHSYAVHIACSRVFSSNSAIEFEYCNKFVVVFHVKNIDNCKQLYSKNNYQISK